MLLRASSRRPRPRTRLHSRYEYNYPECMRWLTGQTLTVFLDAALTKKYTNPSSDIISVLAGLHDADVVLADFVGALDTVIRNGRTRTLPWTRDFERLALIHACSASPSQSRSDRPIYHRRRLPHPPALVLHPPRPLSLARQVHARLRGPHPGAAGILPARPLGQLQQVRVPEPI